MGFCALPSEGADGGASCAVLCSGAAGAGAGPDADGVPAVAVGAGTRVTLARLPAADTAGDDELCQASSLAADGAVAGLQLVPTRERRCDQLVAGTAAGSLLWLRVSRSGALADATPAAWRGLHGAPVTGVAYQADAGAVLSTCEAGDVKLTDVTSMTTRQLGADPSPLAAVAWMSPRTAVTASGNASGQLRLWDVNSSSGSAALTVKDPSPGAAYLCVAAHPTSPDVLAVGTADGVVLQWDVRGGGLLSATRAHAGPIWDVQFHPTAPQHLFTAGEDGQLLLWTLPRAGQHEQEPATRPLAEQLLPFNSVAVDAESSTLVAASDSEGVFAVRGLPLAGF